MRTVQLLSLSFVLLACGAPARSAAPSSTTPASAHTGREGPSCSAVARHVASIGRADRWIAELREDNILPIKGVPDHVALVKLFEVACIATWELAHRRCMMAQSSWDAIARECNDQKVWFHQPT